MDEQPATAVEGSASPAEARVWRAVPAPVRQALETGLPPTDLQTLLMTVARARARKVTAARVMQRWSQDRFVRTSSCDPRRLARLEARLWDLLPDRFAGVELSPVAPLGTCSALAPVDQHRIVSTVRGTEMLSDPTNALAIEAATRRREQGVQGRVDLAACHRVVRAQTFAPGNAAHFRLFALVSSVRDRGSGRIQAELLIDHISFWQQALAELLPGAATRITVTVFGHQVLAERLRDTIQPAVSAGPRPVVEDPARSHGAGYYSGAAIGLRADADGPQRRRRRRWADHLDRPAPGRCQGVLPGLLRGDRAPHRPGTAAVVGYVEMSAITQIFAVLAGLVHVAVFVMESLLFRRPWVQRGVLGRAGADPGVVIWAFNQGFYNLFVAAGAIGGVIAYHAGHATAGRALTLYACGFMAAAGVVLFISDRGLWRGALGQSVPPLIALLAALS